MNSDRVMEKIRERLLMRFHPRISYREIMLIMRVIEEVLESEKEC